MNFLKRLFKSNNKIADLKKQQNEVFIKIYSLIANDR